MVLEMLTIKADMLKLMVTIFKKDKPEVEFFKKALKFEQDETSFVDTIHEQFEYEIFSRYNLIKKKKMEEEENSENVPLNQNLNLILYHVTVQFDRRAITKTL